MKTTTAELANAIRALSMDAVQAANSGHPGMPMGMPGWPELAACTASMDRARMALASSAVVVFMAGGNKRKGYYRRSGAIFPFRKNDAPLANIYNRVLDRRLNISTKETRNGKSRIPRPRRHGLSDGRLPGQERP